MSNSDRDPETGISLVDGPVENPDVLSTPLQQYRGVPSRMSTADIRIAHRADELGV
jgi:hypothetical protein